MFTSLRGGPLWATVAIVVSVLGGATALVWHGSLSGSDWLAVATPILTGGAAIGGVHIANQAAAGQQTPAPAPGVVQNDPPGQAPGVGVTGPISAMPQPGG